MKLSRKGQWLEIVEVNPPLLPNTEHRLLAGRWDHVLVTDNPFKQVRVSPYAYAARITHDSPDIHPIVVCSTRDRNILAIESEVRGALGNGVESFLVVQGDMLPEVEHWSDSYEIVEYLVALQKRFPPFEIGMSVRARNWQLRRRILLGAQFFVAGPVMDPETVDSVAARLHLAPDDPPVYLGIMPPFSRKWVKRLGRLGAIAVSDELLGQLEADPEPPREQAWQLARQTAERARAAGFAGIVLMGLRFETVIGEAATMWRAASSGRLGNS